MPDVLFTWDSLATLTGSSLICFLIVSYTKRYVDRIWRGGTDLYAVFIGTVTLLASAFAQGYPFDPSTVLLAVFNGFLVASTAGKLNDKALQERDWKDSQGAM